MELFVVIAFTMLMTLGMSVLWGKLHNNAYRPFKTEVTTGGVFCTYVFIALIAWALIWATGWFWATQLLVIETAIKMPLRFWQVEMQGYYTQGKNSLVIGTAINVAVIVGLFSALP